MTFIETDTQITKDVYFDSCRPKTGLLYFDIETTGFSAASTVLYFIGCMYFKDGSWKVGQWFNDDGGSEEQLLTAFYTFAKGYDTLIHFNGNGFDLPYLDHKREQYGISMELSHMESIDLYQWMKPYKNVLGLPNLKLKTLEAFLGIARKDMYSGGELIDVYDRYVRTGDKQLFDLLFQHNYEDICNMLDIGELARYRDFFESCTGEITLTLKPDALQLTFPVCLPKKISVRKQHACLTADTDTANMLIPFYNGELKYFFPDYKDYYYLPLEDTAIHKSVAVYMDKDYRRKATRETCYEKVTGTFLPTFGLLPGKRFGLDYKTAGDYMEAEFLTSGEISAEDYLKKALAWFMK